MYTFYHKDDDFTSGFHEGLAESMKMTPLHKTPETLHMVLLQTDIERVITGILTSLNVDQILISCIPGMGPDLTPMPGPQTTQDMQKQGTGTTLIPGL